MSLPTYETHRYVRQAHLQDHMQRHERALLFDPSPESAPPPHRRLSVLMMHKLGDLFVHIGHRLQAQGSTSPLMVNLGSQSPKATGC